MSPVCPVRLVCLVCLVCPIGPVCPVCPVGPVCLLGPALLQSFHRAHLGRTATGSPMSGPRRDPGGGVPSPLIPHRSHGRRSRRCARAGVCVCVCVFGCLGGCVWVFGWEDVWVWMWVWMCGWLHRR